MAQQLQSINLIAPGFKGVNTEDSPLAVDANYSAVADNCVIDRYGRIAARKGRNNLTTDSSALGSSEIEAIHMYRNEAGNELLFSCGNNKILSGTSTLVDQTPGGYTITSDNWDVVNFNNHIYFFQRGHEPLVYSATLGNVTEMSSVPGADGTPPEGNVVLASWGRLWVADFASDKSTVYWSDLLQGHVWTGGSSGSIDISKVWPDGYDEIVSLAAHNNLLIIFGKHSIVVYQDAESPSEMTLLDTVSGVGLVSRDAVQYTGTDVLFLSQDGLRAFGRVIQEKSMPLNDLSRNIKQDLLQIIASETGVIRSVYSPENSFMLLLFPSQELVYCFDTRGTLENGAYRVTRWPGVHIKSMYRDTDGDLYLGNSDGISLYEGYSDNGASYLMKYYSPNLTFGDASRLKILKKMRPTVIGGSGSILGFKWGYDFSGNYKTQVFELSSGGVSEYGVAEYGVAEYSSGVVNKTLNINTTGDGASVVVGLEAQINGASLSLQEYNIWAMIGKLV